MESVLGTQTRLLLKHTGRSCRSWLGIRCNRVNKQKILTLTNLVLPPTLRIHTGIDTSLAVAIFVQSSKSLCPLHVELEQGGGLLLLLLVSLRCHSNPTDFVH